MEKYLDELNKEFFNQVTYVNDDQMFYYFARTYKNGEQDEMRVNKWNGQLWWRPEGSKAWDKDIVLKVA